MTRTEARSLCNDIKAEDIACTVPRSRKPHGYCCQIWPGPQPLRFYTRAAWDTYKQERDAKKRRIPRPNNPIALAIDRACGVTEQDYE